MKEEKKIAIVLGGTNPHIQLITNLKDRGYYTILLDYYENPPAKKYADEHIQESTLDKEKVLEIAKTKQADLVISTSIDQANVTACYVAEKLRLPHPYSYQVSLNVSNKLLMKDIMLKNNVPTAKYLYVNSCDFLDNLNLDYPLVVKPVDSNGSAGVRKVNDYIGLKKGVEEALKISRDKNVIIEEFKEGIEVSIDAFVLDKQVDIVLIRQKYDLPENGNYVLQSPGSFSPGFIGKKSTNKLKKIILDICNAFQLNNTPLLVQAIISDKEVNIIEFAPRVGGGLSYRTVFLNTGFDILDATVNSFLSIKKEPQYTTPKAFLITAIVYAEAGVFSHTEGIDTLIENKTILEFNFYKTKGMVIGKDMTTKSRIGAFIAKADTYDGAIQKVKIAIQSIKVFTEDNKDVMIRYIYDDISNIKKVE